MFRNLCEIIHPSSVKLIKEIDILFLPYEAQVYSFDDDDFFATYFNSYSNLSLNSCGVVAKKLMTLLSTLEEFPLLRYRRRFIKNLVLAEAVEQELNLYKESFKSDTNPKAKMKRRCQLLILDRGFDCISPVVHEFTFQAMAYDILDIKDNIYEYTIGQDDEENVFLPLSDDDALWCSLKHEHVAGVAKRIESMMDAITIIENNTNVNLVQKLPSLGAAVRKHLLRRKHEAFYGYRHMANECMKSYCGGINVLSELEIDLVLGKSADGMPVKNVLTSLLNVLSSNSYNDIQKLRLFLLYIFFNKGITKSHFDEIVNKANLPFSDAYSITNVLHFDVDVFRPRCIDGTLNEELYPFVGIYERETSVSSRRSRYWCADKKYGHMSRLIVFIAGGVTYSEMRCAYEIMAEHTGWEIIVGMYF
ncbi:syntaxin-binding protein 1-like isoform X2 [Stegodyphus dumicola]|uniref:syntaxin-binding protein 1-like isoform X2 n=1 Tax=Stegodyphus dumicola TaxID=202533 RepID=UPI0015A9F6C5|nr:syntaxin-binding protein 1-like isoform X2 [Stegodyphus dumicola]